MKLKKYFTFVLMLFALIGMFTPEARVYADAYDDCMTQAGRNGAGSSAGDCSDLYRATDVNVCNGVKGIGNIICNVHNILNSIVPVLLALGVVYFVWGVVKYMIGGDEESKKKGRESIIYGIIGFAVIVSVWGLVNVVTNTFNLSGNRPPLPTAGLPEGSCGLGSNPKLQHLLDYATCIINKSVIPLIFALALAMFVWGVVQFVINSDEEAKKEKGKQFMLWGIIALTVMISVWGLVNILGDTFGVNTGFIPQVKP